MKSSVIEEALKRLEDDIGTLPIGDNPAPWLRKHKDDVLLLVADGGVDAVARGLQLAPHETAQFPRWVALPDQYEFLPAMPDAPELPDPLEEPFSPLLAPRLTSPYRTRGSMTGREWAEANRKELERVLSDDSGLIGQELATAIGAPMGSLGTIKGYLSRVPTAPKPAVKQVKAGDLLFPAKLLCKHDGGTCHHHCVDNDDACIRAQNGMILSNASPAQPQKKEKEEQDDLTQEDFIMPTAPWLPFEPKTKAPAVGVQETDRQHLMDDYITALERFYKFYRGQSWEMAESGSTAPGALGKHGAADDWNAQVGELTRIEGCIEYLARVLGRPALAEED